MSKFADNQWFEIIHCCNCGMAFAMTTEFQRRRLDDRKSFYCPAGHSQVYTGLSEAQRLKKELDQTTQRLERVEGQVATVRRERDHIAKAHKKMRVRVMNGVCPCCNRSFDNLRMHMETKHPDFGKEKTLRALRDAFGMTQGDVAAEAFTKVAYVSNYERGKPVPVEARQRIDDWLESQAVAS